MKNYSLLSTILFLFSLLLTGGPDAAAQDWIRVAENNISEDGERDFYPNRYAVFSVDDADIKKMLWQMPHESGTGNKSVRSIKLPIDLEGSMDEFTLKEYDLMDAELGLKYPEFKTFHGRSLQNPFRRVRVDYTLHGLRAVIYDPAGSIYIDYFYRENRALKIIYFKKDFSNKSGWSCEVRSEGGDRSSDDRGQSRQFGDCFFRTYRLALACTGEYAQFHGGTVPLVMSAFITSMNRVNGVYEYDVAARMVMVPNNDTLIFLNPNTDPYSNGSGGAMLGQNQTTCDARIGNPNYDIGHVFSTGGGGVAYLSCICNSSNKAGGVTGLPNPIGDPFDIDYVSHEMGHQFGANHTQNNSCNRNNATAMEPGSASTIMGYAGICPPNVQNNSDDYFHAISIQEMKNDMVTGGHNCEVTIDTFNNAPPTVIAQPNYTIPKSTYFYLKLDATDPDGDPMEYFWDQMDNEVGSMPPSPTNTVGPMFRSIKATSSPFRYFPSIDNIVNNTSDTWEVLPSVSRNMDFRGTAKDYHNIGGCNSHDDVTVTVTASSGPFLVTSQASPVSWDVGDSETITWDVANTTSSPVNAATVDIILSVDGGLTYTDTLAINTANDGIESITVPNSPTSTGRIMVKGHNNIFFDINNGNITINQAPGFFLAIDQDPVEGCSSSTATAVIDVISILGYSGNVTFSVASNPTSAVINFNPNPTAIGSSAVMTISNLNGLSGTYPIQISASDGALTDYLTFTLKVVNPASAPVLSSPTDLSEGIDFEPSLFWIPQSDASSYHILVSKQQTFASMEFDDVVSTPFYPVALPLDSAEQYFWKVSSINACGETSFSGEWTFVTRQCFLYESSDVPKPISSSGTPTITSVLTVSDSYDVLDLNIIDLEGTHSYMDDLIFSLTSPSSVNQIFWDQPCGSENNFDINFDDDGDPSIWPCPPIDGLTYVPDNPLNVFNNAGVNGVWTLTVEDVANQDGGSLNSWKIEACTDNRCGLEVYTNNSYGIGSLLQVLECAAPNQTITFHPSLNGDTIFLFDQNIVITKNITIYAAPGQNITIISDSSLPVIDIPDRYVVTLEGLKVVSTSADGQVLKSKARLDLINCDFYSPIGSALSSYLNISQDLTQILGSVNFFKY